MSEATSETTELVRAYGEMWSEHDPSRIPDLVAESFTGEFPEGEIDGRDGLAAYMREFTSAFPDFRVEIIDLFVDQDAVVARGRYTMTHEGEFEGIPPTDRTAEIDAMALFRFEDGKIAEHQEFHDRQALLEQLGVVEE